MSSLMSALNAPAPAAPAAAAAPVQIWPLPNILLTGESSTGKTTSFRNMPWDKTAYIDTENKGMPFEVDAEFMKNYMPCADHMATLAAIERVRKMPHIRYVIVDGFTDYNTKAMITERRNCAGSKDGFAAYKANSDWIMKILEACKSRHQITILTALPETLTATTDDGKGSMLLRRAKVQGREMEGFVEPAFVYAFVTKFLPTEPRVEDRYKFLTQSDGYSLAKSPIGAFKDALISNDMAAVLRVIEGRISKA